MRGTVINYVFILFTAVIIATGCGLNMNGDSLLDNEPDDLGGQTGCEQIIIDEAKYNSARIDDFTIQNAFITNDSLMVLVQYGGGCGTIDFDLLTNGLFMESDPVQLDALKAIRVPCQ